LVVTLPAGASHTATGGNQYWPLTTSLDAPTTGTMTYGSCSVASMTVTCTFSAALAANTAYGLSLSGSGAVAGSFAPVGLQTRLGSIGAGPV